MPRWSALSIQRKIVLTFLPALIPLLGVAWISYQSSRTQSLEASEHVSSLVVQSTSEELSSRLGLLADRFEEWTAEDVYGMAIEFDTLDELGDRFSEMLKGSPDFALLALTDLNGVVKTGTFRDENSAGFGTDALPIAGITYHENRGSHVTTTQLLPNGGNGPTQTLAFSFNCHDLDGEANGYLVAFVDWAVMETRVAHMAEKYDARGLPGTDCYLINKANGSSFATSADAEIALSSITGDEGEVTGYLSNPAVLYHSTPFTIGDEDVEVCYGDLACTDTLFASEAGTSDLALVSLVPSAEVLAIANATLRLNAIMATVGVLCLLALVWVSSGRIARPIRAAASMLQDIAEGEGDLTRRLEVNSTDEVGDMAKWFNMFIERLQTTISAVGETTQTLLSASEGLNQTSVQMNQNATKTAEEASGANGQGERVSLNVQGVATGISEMGLSITEISRKAGEATSVVRNGVNITENTNKKIRKLGDSSSEIGNVIELITGIAEQTNLLALNATIEAARAGEAGKGFAVVAGEVKELAAETARATDDISRRVASIQSDSEDAVVAIDEISEVMTQINELQGMIAAAVEEQSVTSKEIEHNISEAASGTDGIASNLSSVAQLASNTSTGATETEEAATSLSRMADELSALVGQFRT